jgi:uroporphyrinogen-III synthase
MKRTVLITRPEEDALPLAETLRARDLRVLIEPMLRIKPIRDVTIDLNGVQALLFSSSNGVRAFAALNKNRDLPAFTTGEASARVARNLGFKVVEGADGDVNGLVRLVRHRVKPEGGALFHGAGSVVAGDLAAQLTSLGYTLRREVVYEAVQADELSPPLVQKLEAGEVDMVLLFSPRTVETFLNLLKAGGKLDTLSHSTALCMSRQVADAARQAIWRDIDVAERPELNAMLSLIERTTASLDGEPEIPGTVTTLLPGAAGSASKPRETIDMGAPINAPPPPPRRRGRWVWVSAAIIALFVVLAGLATMPAWRSLLGDGREGGGVETTIASTDEPATQTAEAEQPVADTGSTETAGDSEATADSAEPAVPAASETETTATEAAETPTAATEEPATEESASEESAPDEPAAPEAKPAIDETAQTATDSGEAETSGATTELADVTTDTATGSDTGSTAAVATDQPAAASADDPRVDDLQARLSAIEEAIAAAGSGAGTGDTGAAASPEALGAIEQRLATLEQTGTSSAAADELATLSERVTAIEQLLIDFMTEVPEQSLADVKTEVQRLIDENKGLRDQLATLTARFEQADSTAFMLAVGRLGAAINEGRPFEPELATLQTLAAKDPALAPAKASLEALATYAPTGAPSQIALAARFPEVARAIVQAAQQEDAGAATEDAGWWDRIMGRVSELVTVRPVGEDVEGDSPAAHVARAEARIASGDLAGAVGELDRLTGAPAEAAAAWLTAAKARLIVVPAFQALDALALERLGTGAGAADVGTGG